MSQSKDEADPIDKVIANFESVLGEYLNSGPQLGFATLDPQMRMTSFGTPSGLQVDARCWVLNVQDRVELWLTFLHEVDPVHLFARVINKDEDLSKGRGASVQFNPNECLLGDEHSEGSFLLVHSLRVNAGRSLKRDFLLDQMNLLTPDLYEALAINLNEERTEITLGGSDDLAELVYNLFMYAYAIEQVKRSVRGQPPLNDLEMSSEDDDYDLAAAFARLVSEYLDSAPQFVFGALSPQKRTATFGFRGGMHDTTQYWVFDVPGGIEVWMAFVANFSENDLFVRVMNAGDEPATGSGASVQFNMNECLLYLEESGPQLWLTHNLRVNAGKSLKREYLLDRMKDLAPEASGLIFDWLSDDRKSVHLGGTNDIEDLIQTIFVFAYCVEQVKRDFRGQPPLATIEFNLREEPTSDTDEGAEDDGAEDEDDGAEAEEGREFLRILRDKVLSASYSRAGQASFRKALLVAYGNKCAVTGSETAIVLEAAHILGHAEQGSDDVRNGLLLRSDLHLLFDSNRLRIEPDGLTIEIDESLRDSDYWQYNGQALRQPRKAAHRPHVEAFVQRALAFSRK